MFSAVCASQVPEPVFFCNEKSKIDLLGNARSVVHVPATGFSLFSSFPMGQGKTSAWDVVDSVSGTPATCSVLLDTGVRAPLL